MLVLLKQLFPVPGCGGQWRDHQQVINALLFKLWTGSPGRDLPGRYGPWKTAYERLRKWTLKGTGGKILAEAVVKDDRRPLLPPTPLTRGVGWRPRSLAYQADVYLRKFSGTKHHTKRADPAHRITVVTEHYLKVK